MAALFESIPKEVAEQISNREKLHAASARTKDILVYQNSNGPWVRLRSSVNIVGDDAAKAYADKGGPSPPSGDASLARSMVLASGTLNYNENPNRGSESPRGGISFGGKTSAVTGAYHNSPSTGFRPMPGITGVNIQAIGEYGVLRKAELQFKVYSKEDLDDIELLFFRLGMTVLLEWGHTVYTSDGSNVSFADKSMFISNSLWVGYNNDSSVVSELKNKKEASSRNYEAMYAKINNFSWSLLADGSYDCSLSLTSKGVVVEGLLLGKPGDAGASKDEPEEAKVEETLEKNRSIFHYVFKPLEKKKALEKISLKEEALTPADVPMTISKKFNDQDIGIRASMSIGPGESAVGRFFRNSNVNPVYISLRTVLKIINEVGFPINENGNRSVEFDLEAENKYRTFPGHFTLQPDLVMLPKKPSGTPGDFFFNREEGLFAEVVNFANSNGGADNILNIFLSSHKVMAIAEQITGGPMEAGVGIMDLVKSILATMKDSLGDINEFYIHYDEEEAKYSIVDDFGPKKPDIAEITISGLGSTILDISTECKVSGEMASAISIAGNGTQGNYADPLSHLIRFNRGATDRHHPSGAIGDKKPKTNDEIKNDYETVLKQYDKAWKDFNEASAIDPQKWLEMKEQGKGYTVFSCNQHETSSKIAPPMSVPVFLNLTMKGISGFAIGYAFKIKKGLLPEAYKNFAYIVRSVEHSIDESGWVTTIQASMYSLTA